MIKTLEQCVAYVTGTASMPLFVDYERRYDRLDVRAAVLHFLGWLWERGANLSKGSRALDGSCVWAQVLGELMHTSDLAAVFRVDGGSLDFRDDVPEVERRSVEDFVHQNYKPFFDEELV